MYVWSLTIYANVHYDHSFLFERPQRTTSANKLKKLRRKRSGWWVVRSASSSLSYPYEARLMTLLCQPWRERMSKFCCFYVSASLSISPTTISYSTTAGQRNSWSPSESKAFRVLRVRPTIIITVCKSFELLHPYLHVHRVIRNIPKSSYAY